MGNFKSETCVLHLLPNSGSFLAVAVSGFSKKFRRTLVLCLYLKMLIPIYSQLVAECVKHFDSGAVAPESLQRLLVL